MTNSLGLKDASERDVPLQHNGQRILFIGDSFTEGVGIPYEQTWVGLIASALEPDGTDVLNAAVVSYSPKLQYYKVRDLVDRVGLEIDELVVFIDVSDTPDELIYNDFVPVDLDPLDTWTGRFEIGSGRPAMLEYSLIYRTVCRWLDRDPWRRVRYKDKTTGETFDFTNARNEWAYSARIYDLWGHLGLESASFYIGRLLELGQAHGFEVSIGVNPWPDDILHHAMESPYRAFWLDYAARRGVQMYDMYPAFTSDEAAERRRIVDTEFIPDDVHYNEVGHRRFADALLALRGEGR